MQNTRRRWVIGIWLSLLVLSSAVALSAKKKPKGQVIDAEAFGKVRSYCIDTSELGPDEAYDAQAFIKTHSGPKGLFSKLPWKFFSNCRESQPDVRVRVGFKRRFYDFSAMLEVKEARSGAVFYRAEAWPTYDRADISTRSQPHPFSLQRRAVLYSAFQMLISDVRWASQSQAK